jgi:sulfofructose kinase
MPEVVVVGDIDTDNFYIVPVLPGWDEGVLVKEVYERPGGKGGNTVAALCQLGIRSGIIAAIGDDRFGTIAIEGLKSKNVEITGVCIAPGAKTYYCIMMLDPSGEKAILVIDTGLIYPTPQMLQEKNSYLLSARHAHFIGLEPLRMAIPMRSAKEVGLSVSVDLDAGYQGLDACKEAIKWSDVVLINRQGASTLFPTLDQHQTLIQLKNMGPSIVVITSGKAGALGYDGNNFSSFPAFNVPVKDTTGAGDVFSASFIYCYLNKWDLGSALRFASAAAALSVADIGGQSALPSVDAVHYFLNNHNI